MEEDRLTQIARKAKPATRETKRAPRPQKDDKTAGK